MNIINGERRGQWLAALVLGLALVASSWIWGRSFLAARSVGEGLTVKGYAELPAVSTLAVWRGGIQARHADLGEAARRLEEQGRRVEAWLQAQGVAAGEWEWLPLTSWTIYRQDIHGTPTATVEAWQLERPLRLQSSRVAEVAALARRTEELLREGVAWNSQPPEYFLGSLEEMKLELLGKAAADARRRAEILAGGGRRLGGLTAARQGILQVTPPHSVEVADYGMYSTESIDKMVKAVVTVTFALKP
ncbi:MAG: SIMPL domain-containing protein [bacterium]|nr:SIMPL domain-containing protein [bacterium]